MVLKKCINDNSTLADTTRILSLPPSLRSWLAYVLSDLTIFHSQTYPQSKSPNYNLS